MAKRYQEFPDEDSWVRTCQECNNVQLDKEPDPLKEITDSYRMKKCKKCKSEALDYGTFNYIDKDYL